MGGGVADGVGDVDRRGTGVDRSLHHTAEEVEVGPRGILWGELNVVAVAAGSLHARHRAGHHLVFGHSQLELAVDGTRRQKDMDAGIAGGLKGLPRAVDVGVVAPGEPTDHRSRHRAGDLADRLEVTWRRDGKASFDDVDAQLHQRLGDLHFLREIHARPRLLLSVAEGGVKDPDRAARGGWCVHASASAGGSGGSQQSQQ